MQNVHSIELNRYNFEASHKRANNYEYNEVQALNVVNYINLNDNRTGLA